MESSGKTRLLEWGQWREDSIGKSNIKNMKAVIFIERGGTHGRINGCMKATVTEGREKESKSISHPVVYGLSDLGYILPRLVDTLA